MELAGSRFLAEGGKPEYPEKNPRGQIEIDKSQPTFSPRIRSRVVEVGSTNDDHYANLTPVESSGKISLSNNVSAFGF